MLEVDSFEPFFFSSVWWRLLWMKIFTFQQWWHNVIGWERGRTERPLSPALWCRHVVQLLHHCLTRNAHCVGPVRTNIQHLKKTGSFNHSLEACHELAALSTEPLVLIDCCQPGAALEYLPPLANLSHCAPAYVPVIISVQFIMFSMKSKILHAKYRTLAKAISCFKICCQYCSSF